MKTANNNSFLACNCFIILLVCTGASHGVDGFGTDGNKSNSEGIDFAAFQKALAASDDIKALSIGDSIFGRLNRKYRNDAGFGVLTSKLEAAKFLARQMESQLRKATRKHMLSLADELSDRKKQADKEGLLLVAPPKSFYESFKREFSEPVRIESFEGGEKALLTQYYDLKLRILTSAIAEAGQALTFVEPNFGATHDYVLVLPLLHVSDKKPISIDALPRWMQQPKELAVFSESCLLRFGSPFHAMMIAKQAAQKQEKPFSELDFYKSAAQKCGQSRSHIAADCLHKAMDYVSGNDPNTTVALEFELVQLWLDSGDCSLAAGQARKIFETYPNHRESGKAIWLYHFALLRSNNADQILAHVDKALKDRRCEAYKAKLMYTKWCALRRKRHETARVAALEYELLKQYGGDPLVAPVLLSRAIDQLARRDYNGAHESLTQLVEKFPSTKAATEAKRLLADAKSTRRVQ
ncbi:MAG: tetratricopeptide repeat protein [Planctomycetota bacterium]|jgi:hypothetical protein